MVYDLFLFNNELELLDLRLNELKDVVDFHVLIEARQTHQLADKPLHYNDNKSMFSEFSDKIIHEVIEEFPSRLGRGYAIAHYSRNAMYGALSFCKPDDIILLSDADEIPRASKVKELADKAGPDDKWSFIQRTYCYWINGLRMERWMGTVLLNYECLNKHFNGRLDRVRYARKKRNSGFIANGGWHFSFLGGVDAVVSKLMAYTDNEWVTPEYTDRAYVEKCMREGVACTQPGKIERVPIDDSYPQYLIDNIDKFKKFMYGIENVKSIMSLEDTPVGNAINKLKGAVV